MRFARTIAGLAMILVVMGAALDAVAQSKKVAKPKQDYPAAVYCTTTGGQLEVRHAVYGTNNPQQD